MFNSTSGESQVESGEYQDNSDIHHQPFPDPVSEEQKIYSDDDGYQQHHVKHDICLSYHLSPQVNSTHSDLKLIYKTFRLEMPDGPPRKIFRLADSAASMATKLDCALHMKSRRAFIPLLLLAGLDDIFFQGASRSFSCDGSLQQRTARPFAPPLQLRQERIMELDLKPEMLIAF